MSNKSSTSQIDAVATTRTLANHRVVAFWHTMVGKKVVMAVTGVLLILFLIPPMLGNFKIFFRPEGINAYSRFLLEVSRPAFAFCHLLLFGRILLLPLVCL